MKNKIEEVVVSIEKAAANRDVKLLTKLLHNDYRVVANRFKGSNTAAIISKEAYLGMMKDGKIGGTSYDISINDIKIAAHTAMVDLIFASKTTSNMHKYLVLIQNENDQWQVVSDVPLVIE